MNSFAKSVYTDDSKFFTYWITVNCPHLKQFHVQWQTLPTNEWYLYGYKSSPSTAISFMGEFERKYVYTCKDPPHFWGRFIDDIFMIYTLGMEKILQFIDHLNNCHPTIKFTSEISTTTVNFLDIKIKLSHNGTNSTNLFTGETDTHNYLLYSSCYPPSL